MKWQGELIDHPEPTPHEREKRKELIREIIAGLILGIPALIPIGLALLMRYGR